jgi:tRNA(Arg) A34 adenosine deaminase TadA
MKIKYKPKKRFMKKAIELAIKSNKKGEYAIGAVIVKDDQILTIGEQRGRRDIDRTSHAEIVAIRKAHKKLKKLLLEGCVLYTTNEPCPMCTSAAIWAKLDGIVFGANVGDMHDYWVKRGNKVRFDVPTEDILKKQKPRKLFLIKNFMRKECKKLFPLNDKIK